MISAHQAEVPGKSSQIICPACGQSPCVSPYDCGMLMWTKAFFQAMQEAQVDILKQKIQKAWGPIMEKAANGILESMGTCWESAIAQTKAKENFKELLRELWQEGKK